MVPTRAGIRGELPLLANRQIVLERAATLRLPAIYPFPAKDHAADFAGGRLRGVGRFGCFRRFVGAGMDAEPADGKG